MESRTSIGPYSDLICFSHLRWNWVYQRPQHLMSRAAADYRVWFIEEPIFSDGAPARLEQRVEPSGVRIITPHLPNGLDETEIDLSLTAQLAAFLSRIRPRRLIAWYYTPKAVKFTRAITPDLCVYDNMDELSAFVGADAAISTLETELLETCDVVFTGGRSLYESKKYRHENVHCFPSSVDRNHFGNARLHRPEPADQAGIPHPRIGFFGVIDERMNLDLVAKIAEMRPDWRLVMLGPTAKINPTHLPQRENISWLGIKSYDELPDYIGGWNVGIMPFAINDATRFISPTKTPEFLAAGVPVVSTPIRDVVEPYGAAGLVEIGQDAPEFIGSIEMLLSRPRQPWLEKADRHLESMSWDNTWSSMFECIESRAAATVREQANV